MLAGLLSCLQAGGARLLFWNGPCSLMKQKEKMGFLQKIEKIALTSNRKACNIIQVVSERNTASDGEQLPGAERYAGRSYDRRLIRKWNFLKGAWQKILNEVRYRSWFKRYSRWNSRCSLKTKQCKMNHATWFKPDVRVWCKSDQQNRTSLKFTSIFFKKIIL